MDRQERDALEFFEAFIKQEQAEEALDKSHITRREGSITCNIPPSNLLCLAEHQVDLVSLFLHDFNLYEDINFQDWEVFFLRLKGPTFESLVKEFWKMAEWDRHHIVSHVLGRRIIITEKTIGDLFLLDHREGIRIHGSNEDDFICNVINKAIFKDFEPSKLSSEYKPTSLVPMLRIWHRIFLTCINPVPLDTHSDLINADQKYFLYHLQKKDKLCLPTILFLHLKESIQNSRTSAEEDKEKIRYIPFGRIISEILVKNGVIEHPRNEALTSMVLSPSFGDALNARTLKRMGILEAILYEPFSEADKTM